MPWAGRTPRAEIAGSAGRPSGSCGAVRDRPGRAGPGRVVARRAAGAVADEIANAAARGDLQRLGELLDGAADPNAINSYGRTPIQVGRTIVGSWARAAQCPARGGRWRPRRSRELSGAPEAAAPATVLGCYRGGVAQGFFSPLWEGESLLW